MFVTVPVLVKSPPVPALFENDATLPLNKKVCGPNEAAATAGFTGLPSGVMNLAILPGVGTTHCPTHI
jgi:hypothetical protein